MEAMTHHKDHASQTPSCWNLISKRRFWQRHQQDPPQQQTSDGSQPMSTKNKSSTSETKIWRISTKDSLQTSKSARDPHLKPWSISDTTKLSKKNHNHMTTTELHLRNQPLTELNLNTPHVHLVSDAASVTNGWQHPTHIWGPEQDMNQTQVFFPGSDYTSYQE